MMKLFATQSLLIVTIVLGSLLVNMGQAFMIQPPTSSSKLSSIVGGSSCRQPFWLLQAESDNDDDKEPQPEKKNEGVGGFFQGISNFFSELDAFVDDATMRKLGQGAKFYGKRKSNFYGENDKNRKAVRDVNDPSEDYQGPASSGFFRWVPDESGEWKPVTRMKQKNLERKVRNAEDDDSEEE